MRAHANADQETRGNLCGDPPGGDGLCAETPELHGRDRRTGFRRAAASEVLRRRPDRRTASGSLDLQSMVKAGLFREDLLNRLEVFTINVPPLRDRPGDILPLAWHFIKKNADLRQVPVTQMDPEVQRLFREAPGPGTSAGWKTRSFTRWAMEIRNPVRFRLTICRNGCGPLSNRR